MKVRNNTATLILRVLGIVCILVLLAFQKSFASTGDRQMISLNKGWSYYENNSSNLSEIQSFKSKKIDLPHTWNQWDAVDAVPGYRRDASWYVKKVKIDKFNLKNKYFLYFEGSNITTYIYVNGQKAGTHEGGYVGFEINITKFLKANIENTIAIRVDNGYNPHIIPSQKADFVIYGGITRDLWLKVVPNSFIRSVHVTTPKVSGLEALTLVDINFEALTAKVKFEAIVQIKDRISQIIVSESRRQISKNQEIFELPGIKNPNLWSPDMPNLYDVNIQLLRNGILVDEINETIGYRWYSFVQNGAFYLNGKRLLLRGTHRHEDHAGFGAAMPNELHRRDMELIKEVGANFLRLGHYPQDPEVYKACDELGIIVWDELPWCRGGVGNDIWKANTERLLNEQIDQNFNHPSIFFWSLGNEIYWLPDFDNGGDTKEISAFIKKLNQISHAKDPYRMTAIRKYYDGAQLVDVFSPSIWSGWYAGVYTNYEKTLEENQKLYPQFLHMEYGGSSHVGRHTETPITGEGLLNEDGWAEVSNQVNIKNIAQDGDWTENYIVDLFDWYLRVTEQKSDFAGNAQWAFKDFATPLRPENPLPYMNQKGLVDRQGKPKDAFYVFKSYWSTSPFAYIESHTWTERVGPKDKARQVCVYSNCKEVELVLNAKSVGKKERDIKKFPASGYNWDINFEEGLNTLIAIGYSATNPSVIVSDTLILNYSYTKYDKVDDIKMNYSILPNGNYLIEALAVDAKGIRVLDYENRVYFTSDGQGSLYENYGVPTKSNIIEMANGRAAIEFKPGNGKATIECRNQDFKGSYLIIDPSKDRIIKDKEVKSMKRSSN